MLAHASKSWVSSPLGVNQLLYLFKGGNKNLDSFIQNCSKLKDKPECKTRSKIFTVPDSNLIDLLKDTKTIDFVESPRNAALDWVKNDGVLKNYELDKKIPLSAQLILVNISSFKTGWANSGSGTTMKIYNSFSYTQDVKYEARILELPMQDRDFKLIVIAPNQVDLLHTLFRRLANNGLQAALCNIQPLFTVQSKFTAPSMQFTSVGSFETDIHRLGKVPISQIGNANVNNDEAHFTVLSCIYVKWCIKEIEKPDLTNENPPFFFCVVFQDTPIFTGQLNYND